MTITSPIHSFRALLPRPRRGGNHAPTHAHNRIDDPATATRVALDLCRDRFDDLTLALYLDVQHRLVGHAVVSVGWVQAALLDARPILQGSQACQATSCILVRYSRYGALSASEAQDRSFRTIAAACARHGLPVVDHLVVVATGGFSSTFLGGP